MTTKKIMTVFIYSFGILTVIALLIAFFSGVDYVSNPDAMIPFTLREASSICLAVGSVPMWTASIFFYKIFVFKTLHRKRNMIVTFIPAIICTCFFLFWLNIWAIGMILTIFVH